MACSGTITGIVTTKGAAVAAVIVCNEGRPVGSRAPLANPEIGGLHKPDVAYDGYKVNVYDQYEFQRALGNNYQTIEEFRNVIAGAPLKANGEFEPILDTATLKTRLGRLERKEAELRKDGQDLSDITGRAVKRASGMGRHFAPNITAAQVKDAIQDEIGRREAGR